MKGSSRLNHSLKVDVDNFPINYSTGNHAAYESSINTMSDDAIIAASTIDSMEGILQGFRYHVTVLQCQSGGASQAIANGMIVPYNKSELLEDRYSEYMHSIESLGESTIEVS